MFRWAATGLGQYAICDKLNEAGVEPWGKPYKGMPARWTLDCAKNLRLLALESVHVAQYERLGRERFLQEYIQQIAAHGYLNAPFEQEAEAKAIKACRDAGVHPF
jgi:hypothetical protein